MDLGINKTYIAGYIHRHWDNPVPDLVFYEGATSAPDRSLGSIIGTNKTSSDRAFPKINLRFAAANLFNQGLWSYHLMTESCPWVSDAKTLQNGANAPWVIWLRCTKSIVFVTEEKQKMNKSTINAEPRSLGWYFKLCLKPVKAFRNVVHSEQLLR